MCVVVLILDYSLFYMQADFIGIRCDMPITLSLTAAPSGGAVLAAPLSLTSALIDWGKRNRSNHTTWDCCL